MADIAVEIFGPNKTANTEEVPLDMKAGDFLAEIAEMIELRGTGWRLYDKDLQRDLDPEMTMGANGVATGHHIYFRQTDLPPVSPRPPAQMSRWLWLPPAIGAFLLGAAVSYLLRGNVPDPAVPQLRRQLQERDAIVSGLKAQLDQSSKSLDEKTQNLMTDLAARTAEAQDLKTQMGKVNQDLMATRRRVADLLSQQLKDSAAMTDFRQRSEQAKAHSDQVDSQLARANQTAQALQEENTTLRTQLSAARLAAGQTKKGASPPSGPQPEVGMLVWTAPTTKGKLTVDITGRSASIGNITRGTLPNAPCIIYQGFRNNDRVSDKDRVDIRFQPTPQNGYHLVFDRKNGGSDTVMFFWSK